MLASSRLTSPETEFDIVYLLIWCDKKEASVGHSFPKIFDTNLRLRKASYNLKLGGISQDTWPGLFQVVQVIQNKEKLRNCHICRKLRWSEDSVSCGTLDGILDPKRKICGETGGLIYLIYSEVNQVYLIVCTNVNFLVLTNVPGWCKLSNKGELGEACTEFSIPSSELFYKSKDCFKILFLKRNMLLAWAWWTIFWTNNLSLLKELKAFKKISKKSRQ